MRSFYIVFLVFCAVFPSVAQKKKQQVPAPAVSKKALHHSVYDSWEEIPEQVLSDDGKYAAFVINPQQGDGYLYLYRTADGHLVSRIARGSEVKFTGDGGFAVFRIKPQFLAVKEARRSKKKKEELPKDSLGLFSLVTGELVKWPSVISYQVPEKGSGWLAFQAERAAQKTPSDSLSKRKPRKENEENGYSLTLVNLPGKAESNYPFVKEYVFSEDGARLAFSTVDSAKSASIMVWERGTDAPHPILKGLAGQSFKKIAFDKSGTKLAFVGDLDTNAKTQIRRPQLYSWKKGDREAQSRVGEGNQPGPQGWLVNADFTPRFSKDGRLLYYGINPLPVVPDTTLLPEEIVDLEVWHWQDATLQTQQKVTAEADKKKACLAVLNLADGKSTALATTASEAVSLVNEGDANFVVVSDPGPYLHAHWDWNPKADIYLVSTENGAKKRIRERLEGKATASPLGKYVYWFSNPDTAWFAYSTDRQTLSRLTDNQLVRFADEEDDHPDFPSEYGIAGWTTGDEYVVIYDRYDCWLIDPLRPGNRRKLTDGRERKQRYRYIPLDPDQRNIDLGKPLLLRSFNETTKQEGFYVYSFADNKLTREYEGDFRIGAQVRKARAADKLLFTRETFRDFPNWYVSDLQMKHPRQITHANRQQEEYLWGTVELVEWNSADGKALKGLLYKPENFDPKRKYPMMTYFYERNSDNLHTHFAPKPIRSYINFSYFTSNDYLVFVPDIVYEIGYPGQSAYSCVVPGVLNMIGKGFVDESRIGISGHSWGGYQTAYLVTRTHLFKAAEAGAPVANMTSAYGGVRWDTGLVRQAQYEKTQSRIGGTLWEKPLQFIENSPLFFADRVQTPLLMMHNDNDGAVPWYQGIEFFLALKRLNKPVWMLNYVGEKHGLTKRQNMTDFAVRLYQYFDHYLKGAPRPEWMETGLPYLEKGINQRLQPASKP
ncbi:prolyl oligopeptidase family serine peptidase [Ravibacter arvi]|uniref:Prolyl oligopeptidase family serine peptidase n=1 Tax=Ravibacter arvi TaxID=2051041 RepID=A0ABP8LQF8_9BACT